MKKHRITTSLGVLGLFSDRYVPGGYWDEIEFRRQLEIISGIKGIDSLFVWYPGHPLINTPGKLKSVLADHQLVVGDILADTFSDKRWKAGSLASPDRGTRKAAVDVIRKTMDLAVELGAHSVLVWPAHDGYDYFFQADYAASWQYLIDGLNEAGEHNPDVKIAIEYKHRDPRGQSYLSDAAKSLLLIKDLRVDNVGCALDVGHSFFSSEKSPETLALLDRNHKLYQIHLNDNHGDADNDLLFGSIHFWETLEFFYWLAKTDFNGWLNLDIVSPRDDRARMLATGVNLVRDYERLADKLLARGRTIESNLRRHDFIGNMDIIRELVFK